MTLLNENLLHELQRMSKLAGVSQNTINESDSTIINSKKTEPKKLLKEDDDDIFGDNG